MKVPEIEKIYLADKTFFPSKKGSNNRVFATQKNAIREVIGLLSVLKFNIFKNFPQITIFLLPCGPCIWYYTHHKELAVLATGSPGVFIWLKGESRH